MVTTMNKKIVINMVLMLAFIAVSIFTSPQISFAKNDHKYKESDHYVEEPEKGSNGGKLFRNGDFAVEVTIYEDGVSPQFRVYSYGDDNLLDPSKVNLTIQLNRLDGEVNNFSFKPQDGILVSDGIVTEPHSFDVVVKADYDNKTYKWNFESYEGRTQISEEAALEGDIKTQKAGSAIINQYAKLTGRITLNRNTTKRIRARFPGVVKKVYVNWGDEVKKGQVLAVVESNESLKSYNIIAPMNGVILERDTNVGDVAGDSALFTIADLSNVWAELHVFSSDLEKVQKGQKVQVSKLKNDASLESNISMILPTADALSQSVLAIVPLDNKEGKWRPGMTVEGNVIVNRKEVPLAVRSSALQKFRDFTVVFAKYDDTYEVRMLKLGVGDGKWVEVLEGLKPNTEYVTNNSFLIKADIEKSVASHDH